ncbi:MAG: hypothetical protein M0R80_00965 [Proteobacteria bacterium]|nr:hypothetical protein [Pseudomonadota bacterium]
MSDKRCDEPGWGGYHVKAKDLITGEMFMFQDMDAFLLHGPYWKVIGHEHEKQLVLIKDIRTGSESKAHYDQLVRVRPFAYKFIREECLKDWIYYKEWPYDEEGHFCEPSRDYSGWKRNGPLV